MKIEEAIDYNKNLRMYMKISDKYQPCKFLEENHIALDMAIKSLEAWEKIKEEIEETKNRLLCTEDEETGLECALIIINKHLSEVEE